MDNSNQPEDSNITSPSSKLQFLKGDKGLRIFIWVSLTIALGVVLYAFWYTSVREEPIFTVGDEEFRESDIEDYVQLAATFGVNQEYAYEGIEQAKIFILTAEEFGVSVDDDQIRQALIDYSSYDEALIDLDDKWIRLVGERMALERYIADQRNKAAQGYAFAFDFSTYADDFVNPNNPNMSLPDSVDENLLGDEDMVEEDREYAREQAERYRSMLIEDEASPEEVLDEIMDDERLHRHYTISREQGSARFGHDPDETIETQVSGSVSEYIQSFSGDIDDGPTEIEVGELRYAGEEDRGMYEGYYFFIYFTDLDSKWYELEDALLERGVGLYL